MRLHRFYVKEKIVAKSDLLIKSDNLSNQIGHVFRLKKGDGVILFDGSGNDYECAIEDLRRDSVALKVSEGNPSRFMSNQRVFLYQSIIKKDKFEWIVEKATELGVTDIVPVLADRSEKKSLNEDRLRKICIEASEQSGRGDVPIVHPILSTKAALAESVGEKIVFHLEGQQFTPSSAPLADAIAEISIFIGPEGGWSPAEIEMFHSLKIPIYSFGKQVLRSETATIVAISKFLT